MLNRFIILLVLIFFSSNVYALKLEKGEYYQGEIKKVESYMYNFKLPSGEWEVTGIDRTLLGDSNFAYAVLTKIKEGAVEAFIWLSLVREPSDYGWYAGDPGVCTDWDNQGSNFHSNNYKESMSSPSIGPCLAIYVTGDVWPGIYDDYPEFVQTKKKLKRYNVNLPDTILWIEQELITKEALAHIYIGINPEIVGIDTPPNQEWTYSDWDKYNIENFPEKDSFMKKSIKVGKSMQEQNYKALGKRKVLDLSFIDSLLK